MSTRTISTLEELKAFRDEVNAGNTFKGETIELANDIDLGGEEWTPIGTQSHQFQGIFNGNGHTISNLKINSSNSENSGFFGFTTNGEIKNLTFNNADVVGYLNVGVVAGCPYTSKYSNIKLTGDIKVSGYAYVGGMFGKNAYADLTDLTIDANAGSYVKADSQKYRTYVGGIVGFMGEGNQTVMNVISNISVIGSTCDIGGIAGIAHYGNKFINVVCAAELIQLVNANDDGDHLEIGGIAGVWLNQSGETVLLLNCSAENTTLKSSLKGVDRSEDVKGNDITGRSYSEETSTSGSLIIGNVKTSETGSEYVFTVSGPKAADDLKAIFGDSLQDNGDGTYTSTTFDMSAIYVNEAWAGKKNGDMVEYGVIGVNAFAKANDAINAAGANATIKIQDARDYNTPITKASYTENLTIESQKNSYSQLYMTVSSTTYTYGEEDENGNAVRHDATVEYKLQDIFFGGHSHFESLAGMTVKFIESEITHEGGTPFFKVYGDSNVIFDGANYANENGNLWFYVSGQLDLLNDSTLETEGGSGFRILAAGGKVNVDKSSLLRVSGSNISIGSYYVYSDKTAKAVVGGKKQGHDADGSNDYSATLNITNSSGLVNVNGIVRVGASYILDNATTDELEGLTITDNPDKPANYADLVKACLNITDASAKLDRLYVDGNGAVTIRNSTLTANSITLADGSSLTVNAASAVTTGTLTNNGTITIDATGVTSGSHKVIDTDAIAGPGSIIAKDGTLADDMNLVIADNDVYVTDQKQDVIYVGGVNAAGEKSANTAAPAEALQGWNKFDTMKDAFKAGALGNNTIDFGNAGRVVSDNAFIYTPETIELGKGEYTISNGAGAYLPRLTMNSRDVVVNIKKAHLTLSKYRSGKDSNGELGGASLNITDSRVDGGNEVDDLMWVTSYADSTIEITNSRVGLRDSYTGEAENVTLGNTGNYLDWGSYGNLALKVSGTAVIKDSTIFAGYHFSTIGDADGATIDVTNSVVYASAVETDGTNGLASLSLLNSALRQSGWGNGSENYNFLVKKGATVSLTNGSNLWWARAAQVRVPYGGELCDSVVIDNGGKLELFYDSTAEVGNITNNGKLVIYESTLKAMTITNNNYFAINNNSAITAEFSAAGTGFITVQDAAFGADTVINSTASYTNQGIGSEILMFGTNILANGANISTGWSKDLRIGFGTDFPSASISITSGAKLNVGGNTYIGSALEAQSDAAYTVFVTGAGSEFNGSGASGDLYLRADGMLTIQNGASASFSYFNGKGVLNVLNATFKSLNFNIADSGKLTFVNGAKATLGNTATASTARGDISVRGDETELNLIGDIKYGRTNTAADFTVKSNAAVTVNGNIELGYFTQTSGVMAFYKGSLSLTDNAKFTTAGTITVFLDSAIAMDHTSRLTFGGLTAQNGSITIAVSGYTDGIYKVMENTGANAVDYATVISNWSEIEKVGCTVVNNSLYIGSVDMTKLLVSADYSKYSTGDAIEGKDGFFYGFNAFTTAKDALKAANANGGAVIDLQNDGYVYAAPSYDTMKINKAGIYKLTGGNGTLLNYTLEINSDQTDDAYTFNIENANLTLTKLTLRKNTEMNITDSRVDYNFFEGGSAYLSVYGNSVLKISNSTVGDDPNAKQKSEGIFAPTWTVYGTLEVTDSTLYSYVGQGNQSGFNASGNGQISLTNSNISLSLITVGYEYEAKKLNPGADEDNLLATMLFDNTEVKNTQYRGDYNTKNGILVGSEDGKTAGKLIIRNGSNVDFTLKRYEDKREVGLSILNGKSSVEITTGSTLKTPSVTNAGTISVTNSVLYVNGTLTNSGTINVKAGKNVSFKAGALTNNGEFAVDGGSYQGGTVKVIDLDSINGAEIIVNNIDSKYVYRGDDGDVLFSDASKEILKGNTSWSSIAFGDAVTEAGTDFYKGVNAFDNGTGLWAQFEENVTTEVEIGAGDFTDGNATSAIHRFIGGKNVVIRSTAAGDDYAVLSKDSTFEYGVADEATIDADYTITLEGNQQYDWLQVRAAQKDWQTGSTEAGKQIKLNADGTAQAPDHLITLNVNGKVIAKTLNVKEGTLINIDASKGGSLTGNGNGGGGYVVRGMMNVIGKNGTDFDSEATLNLNGAAFTVGYAPNSSKVRGPAFVNITDKAVVTNIMHSFLNFQAPGSILNVDNAKLDVGHIQEATAENVSYDFTFNVKNKADVHAKNSIVLGQDAQNGDDGIFSFNVENSTVAADWNIELKTFSDTTLSTSKMSAAKDFILNGNLSMQNVSTLTVGGNFTNTGSISVGSGSSLDVGNTFINQGTFNLNWNASLKMGSFDATSSSITIDMTGFDNKEHALVVVNDTTLDETAVISIVGQDFYDKYKGYLRYDGNTLYLTENLSAEVYVSSGWAGKGQGETVDYNGNSYTIGTNAFGTVEEAKAVNPLLIHIVDGTISKTALEAVKTVLEGDATYTGVITAGTRVNDGVDNRRTVDGDTNVTVNGGTFRSHLIGADSQISGSIRRNGNVTLTINGGDFEKQVAGGMYFYAQNPFDEAVLNGDVNMTINGGTFVKRVYGGCFTQLENEYTAQTKIVGDINLTIDASVNTITFNNMVTAGSRGTGRIYGDINVKVTGAQAAT